MVIVRAFICGVLLAGSPVIGGPAFTFARTQPLQEPEAGAALVFGDVEKGMVAGSVAQFSSHLGQRIYLQLPESEEAHYSAHQAFYVLDLFLRRHKVLGVKFSRVETTAPNPYATGSVTYLFQGARQDAHLYVSLAGGGDDWMITHLSIY